MAYCAGRRTTSSCFCFFSFAFFISRCAHGPLFFCLLSSWDERTKKVMSMPVFCNWFRVFPLSAGTKAMAKPILLSVLLLFFSFSFLCFVFFSSIFLLYVFALVFSVFGSIFLGFLLPFIEIPQLPPLTSPAFAELLFATNEIVGERHDPWLDRIRCKFLACWIGMEKTNTVVPPATTTFRQQWTFSFWPLNVLNSTIEILISNN